MNQIDGLLILLALPVGLLLAGYWLAARLPDSSPLDRLAAGLLAGLASLLAMVCAVNFYQPLSGFWAYFCLCPVAITLLAPGAFRRLYQDVLELARSPNSRLPIGLAAVFFLFLLWPALGNRQLVYYDGTTNHDSFFWIAGAEYLKRHTYMEPVVPNATQPFLNSVAAITGWRPPWGRMGAEGLIALTSSVINLSPLKLFLYASASLYFVWLGTVWLVVRTFVVEKPGRLAGAAMILFQPIFIFFYGNVNLPNLFGVLTGTAVILATERALQAPGVRWPWLLLLSLSLHGLLGTYPEMVPFVLLPVGLLGLRRLFVSGAHSAWRAGGLVALALLAGILLNPATTLRAVNGFFASYSSARDNQNWANLFAPLKIVEYFPTFWTLAVQASMNLGAIIGAGLTAVLAATTALAWRHTRDRVGLLAGFSGSMVLLVYTLVTGFDYGWQKTIQFAGIFFSAFVPVTLFHALDCERSTTGWRRQSVHSLLVVCTLFLGYATYMNCRDIYIWSDRKVISQDWFTLRNLSREMLHDATVIVDAATFNMAFFHSMWSAYFLSDSNIYYALRGKEGGGYLRYDVLDESVAGPPAAILVGRPWADAIDANSTRLLTGQEFVLLAQANRFTQLSGVYPLNGPPAYASQKIVAEIVPHSPSRLILSLSPRLPSNWTDATWRILRRTDSGVDESRELRGSAPWEFDIPLTGQAHNQIELSVTAPTGSQEDLPFIITQFRIEDTP